MTAKLAHPNKPQFTVQGHTLPGNGKIYNSTSDCWENGPGHARCSCGTESPYLKSTYARREWHVQHKREVLDAGVATPPPQPSPPSPAPSLNPSSSSPLPSYSPPPGDTITRKCPTSGQLCEESLSPTFDKSSQHVNCPNCHRIFRIREDSNLYPTHYVRVSSTRDDEIAKTRMYSIPGLYVEGRGSEWQQGTSKTKGRWQVWKLTYRNRAYLLWHAGRDYYWSISPYDPFEYRELAVSDTLEGVRGIVVDWGAGGSVYEDYSYDPPRDKQQDKR